MYLCPQPKHIGFQNGVFEFNTGSLPEAEKISDGSFCGDAYRLTVTESGITARAGSESGFHAAEITLKQLLMNCRGVLPCLDITDSPAYSYRGFMIDSCRHFFTVDEIKKMIDAAELFKFNYFHFHLSDDQGFRIESKVFPELTEIASVRHGSHFDIDDDTNEQYGPYYYTQAELRDIVEYCRKKCITVIPEIDLPGHTGAILSAFPQLSCGGKTVEAKTTGGVFSDILCGGKAETLDFLKKLADELCAIFPGEYFHIGGDEAPKDHWEKCPDCLAKMRELGFTDPEQLQGYIVNEMARYLRTKGKKVICWNEALRGGNVNADGVTAAFWMDNTDATIKWANAGNPVIYEKFTPYYADYPYGMHPLKAVYTHDPKALRGLTETGRNAICGVESPIWTEHVRTFERMNYMCFPRWLAVAETGWNGSAGKNYAKFKKNAAFFCDILREYGINAAPESDWDSLPHKRLAETLRFFRRKMTKETVAVLMKKEN